MPAPSAGEYDPVPAAFFSPVYDQTNHEPTQTGNPEFNYPIRFRPRDSMELQQQSKTTSKTMVYVNVRDTSDTRNIRANWWFTHRGIRYDVVGDNPLSYLGHELQFLANTIGFSS